MNIMNTAAVSPLVNFKAEVSDLKPEGVPLWRLPLGARFEDWNGKQVFEKIGECSGVRTRRRMHQLRCVQSPFTRVPGPVCAAFFCAIGDVIYREGSLRVFPVGSREEGRGL